MQWDSRVERLGEELFSAGNIPTRVGELLDQVADELKDRELKALKEDMAALADGGGLQGRGLIVRRERLPAQAEDHAQTRQLVVVLADQLHVQLRKLLGS